MKYLFAHWNDFKKNLENQYVILFLDYDGTLTPIVKTPEQAIIPSQTKKLLSRLSQAPRAKLAIISGRALEDVKDKVGLKNVIYVGNHGLEIEGPKIQFRSSVSIRYKNMIKKIGSDLRKKISLIKGALVEDKDFSLSLHYRLVNKKDVELLKRLFRRVTLPYLVNKKIKIKPGKMVLEVRPALAWDKGKIALWLLARQKFTLGKKPTLPIYIGDDITDEDAFRALKNEGLTIFVGRPKESYAEYYLKNTNEVSRFLKRILVAQEGQNICPN